MSEMFKYSCGNLHRKSELLVYDSFFFSYEKTIQDESSRAILTRGLTVLADGACR
jgi:hypothetical protein